MIGTANSIFLTETNCLRAKPIAALAAPSLAIPLRTPGYVNRRVIFPRSYVALRFPVDKFWARVAQPCDDSAIDNDRYERGGRRIIELRLTEVAGDAVLCA